MAADILAVLEKQGASGRAVAAVQMFTNARVDRTMKSLVCRSVDPAATIADLQALGRDAIAFDASTAPGLSLAALEQPAA